MEAFGRKQKISYKKFEQKEKKAEMMERDLIPEIKRTERTKDIWRGKTHRWRGSSERAAKRAEKRQ